MQTYRSSGRLTNNWLHYTILAFFAAISLFILGAHVLMLTPMGDAMMHMKMSTADADTGGKVIPYQSCSHIGATQVITIEHNAFVPDTLTVTRCDMVEFLDKDHGLYLPRFGDHPNDITYTGFPQKVLGYDQSETFVAHTAGVFNFHDHLKDKIEGVLTVQ